MGPRRGRLRGEGEGEGWGEVEGRGRKWKEEEGRGRVIWGDRGTTRREGEREKADTGRDKGCEGGDKC